jgi:hypothetical protein
MTTTTTTTMLDFTRKRGRELLAEARQAEADQSLFDPQIMAKVYGKLEYILGQLLDELDASDEATGGDR